MSHRCTTRVRLSSLCLVLAALAPVSAEDWPMWRYDAGRTAASPRALPADLAPIWTRDLPSPEACWPDAARLSFDASYEPIIWGDLVIIGSMVEDSLTAYDTATGDERWCFYASGPIRFAPAAYEGRLYVGSDDGNLYCLDAATGGLVWRHRAAPGDLMVAGNTRLVSAWPVRGAPVVRDGRVYLAASIWPFMGTFYYALDAETGEVVWCNSGSGSIYMTQPHHSPAFAGVAPQGYIALAGTGLLIPSGRSVPGCYSANTGDLRYFWLEASFPSGMDTRRAGGYKVAALGEYFVNASDDDAWLFRASDGELLLELPSFPVLTADSLYAVDADLLRSYAYPPEFIEETDRRGATFQRAVLHERWSLQLGAPASRPLVLAGETVYGGKPGGLWAAPAQGGGGITWEAAIDGTPWALAAGDDKLFAVTQEGRLACFGQPGAAPVAHPLEVTQLTAQADGWTATAARLIEVSGAAEGYAVLLGSGSGRLAEELARQSDLHIIAIEPDLALARSHRDRWRNAGLYGERLAVVEGDPSAPALPPFFASLIASEAGVVPAQAGRLLESLRPYGGTACLPLPSALDAQLDGGFYPRREGDLTIITRGGPLPGAGEWTHQFAGPANSGVSTDTRVRAPLGLLWFGGPSNENILPRHGHGPSPQVAGGRCIIEGPDILRALDVYTGRLFWEREFAGIGAPYNETAHQPGANALGTNYVTTADAVYVLYGGACLVLDPATGETLARYPLPHAASDRVAFTGGYLGVTEDIILVGEPRMDLWTPEFSALEIAGLREADLRDLADALSNCRRWQPQGQSEGRLHEFAIENLNRLLNEADLLSVLPESRVTAADQSSLNSVKSRFGADGPATEGDRMHMNRMLLCVVFQKLPYIPQKLGSQNPDATTSRRLIALDRRTGEPLWSHDADQGFWHNAIAVGDGAIFAIDRLPRSALDLARRRGGLAHEGRIVSLDLRTGDGRWSTTEGVFGTWLSYSSEHGVLLQAGAAGRDRSMQETSGRMAVYRGADGSVVWDRSLDYTGPCLLHGDTILTQGTAYGLLTGERASQAHPITGEEVPWTWKREYGCNTAIASRHLITFRSAAAGYYDLAGDGGTANLGGFRASCTSNLIVADGVLCAPDYTRTCNCSYQNQSSVGLIHMPEVEMWTFSDLRRGAGTLLRLGLNLGAPGDRRADNGILWLDLPSVGGPSPDPEITTLPENTRAFRLHSSLIQSGELPWVAASGLMGLESLTVPLGPGATGTYTVRLVFAEPEPIAPGQRVFDVLINEAPVLTDLDIAARTRGARRSLVETVEAIAAAEALAVSFVAKQGEPLLCGIEIVAGGAQ